MLPPSRIPTALTLAVLLAGTACAPLDRLQTTARSPLDWNGHNRIELPLTLDSVGRPTVPGRIMGHDTMVLIDSGGGYPSMTEALAAAAGAQVTDSAIVNGSTYEAAENVPVQLGAGSIELRKVTVGEQTVETQFTLGPELFLQAIVDMDFDAGRMTLIQPAIWTPPADRTPIPVQLWGTKPTVQLRVNGHEQSLCAILDTGFNSGVALSGEVLTQLALPHVEGQSALTGFGGVKWQAPALAPLREVGFSEQMYRDVPLSEKKSATQWACPNLLGMAVLSRHHLIFDLQNHRVWMLPRSSGTLSAR